MFKNIDWEKAVGMFVVGPIKRLMEDVYNKLGQTEIGMKLKESGKLEKYTAEGILNLFSTYADQTLPEGNVFSKALKELITDAGPEISKRIHNNETVNQASQDFKKVFLSSLRKLGNKDREAVINWLSKYDEQKRQAVLEQIPEELEIMAELKPRYRDKLADALCTKPKSLLEELEEKSGPIADSLEKSLEEKKKRRGKNV